MRMDTFGWLGLALYLLLATVALIASFRPHSHERAVLKFAENVGLPLPQRLAEPILHRMLARRRSSTVGGMVGAVATALVLLVSPSGSDNGSLLTPLFIVAGIFAGATIGTSVSAVKSSSVRAPSEKARYARVHAVELHDYVSRVELWLARVPVVLAVVAVVAGVTLAGAGVMNYTGLTALLASIALSLVAVSTLIAHEVVGRRVVAMGNHVGSPEELVWEDALRAMTIRELAVAPTFLGYYALLMAINPLLVSPDDSARTGFAIASLGVAILTAVIALGMLVSVLAVKRHFLRRLWPELAATAGNPHPTTVEGG